LRHTKSIDGLALVAHLGKVSMILELPKTVDELAVRLGSKLRSQIRRAEREQPQVAWGGMELLPEFYRVFSQSMRDLGTPVYPRKFFQESCAAFEELASVLVVRAGGVVQAAAIIVRHRDGIEVPWAAATVTAKTAAINMKMYWELLKYSVEQGASYFDFGRSTVNSGTYRFKAQWGAVPHQLHWHYWLPTGTNIPQLNNANPQYARAAAIWRRMPLWCANLLGPYIVRNLP
jgi:serine/alanine adding enzyme